MAIEARVTTVDMIRDYICMNIPECGGAWTASAMALSDGNTWHRHFRQLLHTQLWIYVQNSLHTLARAMSDRSRFCSSPSSLLCG